MVGTLLGLPEPPDPDHAADALAVAICHAGNAAGAAQLSRRPTRARGLARDDRLGRGRGAGAPAPTTS